MTGSVGSEPCWWQGSCQGERGVPRGLPAPRRGCERSGATSKEQRGRYRTRGTDLILIRVQVKGCRAFQEVETPWESPRRSPGGKGEPGPGNRDAPPGGGEGERPHRGCTEPTSGCVTPPGSAHTHGAENDIFFFHLSAPGDSWGHPQPPPSSAAGYLCVDVEPSEETQSGTRRWWQSGYTLG